MAPPGSREKKKMDFKIAKMGDCDTEGGVAFIIV